MVIEGPAWTSLDHSTDKIWSVTTARSPPVLSAAPEALDARAEAARKLAGVRGSEQGVAHRAGAVQGGAHHAHPAHHLARAAPVREQPVLLDPVLERHRELDRVREVRELVQRGSRVVGLGHHDHGVGGFDPLGAPVGVELRLPGLVHRPDLEGARGLDGLGVGAARQELDAGAGASQAGPVHGPQRAGSDHGDPPGT